MKNQLLTILTSALALCSGAHAAPTAQITALDGWVSEHLPDLEDTARDLFTGPFQAAEVTAFIGEVVEAARELPAVFSGTDKAQVVKIVVITLVHTFVPASRLGLLAPLLSDAALSCVVEAAYRLIRGAEAQGAPTGPAPVVDAPEVPAATVVVVAG